MEQNNFKCPKCGKELRLDSSGTIGWCSVHKEWFAVQSGFEAAAVKRNEAEERERKQKILRLEEEKQQQLANETKARRSSFINKFLIFTLLFVFLVIILFVFLVRPIIVYKEGITKMNEGDYQEAITLFEKNPEYKSSQDRIIICQLLQSPEDDRLFIDAMVSFFQNNSEPEIKDEIAKILSDWKKYGFSAVSILEILDYASQVNLDNSVDIEKIRVDAHIDLLDSMRDVKIEDIDDDNENELIVLTTNFTIECYEMVKTSNQRKIIDNVLASSYLLSWGEEFRDTSLQDAMSCYLSALDLNKNEDTIIRISTLLNSFPLNVERIKLRTFVLSLFDFETEDYFKYHEMLGNDLKTVVENWSVLNISASDLLEVIRIAVLNDISIENVNLQELYHDAVLLSVPHNVVRYEFVDWNEDNFEDLLFLSEDGKFEYWVLSDEWSKSYEDDLRVSNGSFEIFYLEKPVIVVFDKNSFSVYVYSDGKVVKEFGRSGLKDIHIEKDTITYSVELAGSIIREEKYEYVLNSFSNIPIRIGIDWHENNYPYPLTPESTLLRWLEAIFYNISEEKGILEQDDISSIPVPKDCSNIKIQTFAFFDEYDYLEAVYEDEKNEKAVIWAKIIKDDSGCKISEAFNRDVSPAETQSDILPLNQEIRETALGRNISRTYKFYVPQNARINLTWQSGNRNIANTIYQISIYKDDVNNSPLITYDLQSSLSMQQSYPLFVEAGIYYVNVRALSANEYDYRITIDADMINDIEIEPNDSFEIATAISPKSIYHGSLISPADVDHFKFSIKEASKVSITLSSEEDGNRRVKYQVSILDLSSYSVIHSFSLTGTANSTKSANLYLGRGDYGVVLQRGDYHSGVEYTITFSEDFNITQEVEDNGNRASSNTVILGEEIIGSFGKLNDYDWFNFTLENDIVITPEFRFVPLSTSTRAYNITFLNDSVELLSRGITGGQSTIQLSPMVLSKGTYYIRLNNLQETSSDYSFLLNSKNVTDAEDEPNNSLASAKVLSFSTPITGNIWSEEDEDYFKFNVSESARFLLRFTFEEQSINSTLFILTIERNGSVLWRQAIRGVSGGISQELEIAQGEYFIRIRPSTTWNDVIYELNMEKESK